MSGRIFLLLGCLMITINDSYQQIQIPRVMFERLGNTTNVKDLIENLLMKSTHEDEDIPPLFTKPGKTDPVVIDVLAGKIANPDICSPKVESVAIPADPDPTVVYFPACIALERCGGCGCGHGMLECAPVLVDVIEVEVMKMKYPYPEAAKFTYEGNKQFELQRHRQCECRCRVQPHHCHATRHLYEEHSCRCKCINQHEALSCPSHKIWSEDECKCVCPKRQWCYEDEYFSNQTCRCEIKGENYVKIIDEVEVIEKAPGGLEIITEGPCKGITCRPGFRPVAMNNYCQCRIATSWSVQSGSIVGRPVENPDYAGPALDENVEQVNIPEGNPEDLPISPGQPSEEIERERVPADTPLHTVKQEEPTTEEPRETRTRRPSRNRRPRPGAPIRNTGVMVPGG